MKLMIKKIVFDYSKSDVSKSQSNQLMAKLTPELRQIGQSRSLAYETDYASINLPFDKSMLEKIQKVVTQKKNLSPSLFIVIGIGGSNLGTIAVHEALNGVLYNEKNPNTKVYFADTVDTDYLFDLYAITEAYLQQKKIILINVVTKSGTTTETIINFQIFLNLLKKYHPDNYHDYVVVTTDIDSPLWNYAYSQKMIRLEVPKNVGGRYSVFSAVGLFPLGMLDVDLEELCTGARDAIEYSTSLELDKNMAALSAILIYQNYLQGKIIDDTFLFSVEFEAIGKWYRQLMGESIGKEFDRVGKKVEVGITPTVSIGSIDLHSVAQLYLGGPRDKFTTFILLKETKEKIIIPKLDQENLVADITGKSVKAIMQAIEKGTRNAYEKSKRPFCSFILEDKSAYCIGELLQIKMLEMIYLGFLFNINPFDQPAVEKYKEETRKILSHG